MATIPEYYQRVNQILGTDIQDGRLNLSFKWETPGEAKILLSKIRIMQKELRLVKKDLAFDIQSIRSGYITSKAKVGQGAGSAISSLLLGRKVVGRGNAWERESLRRQQISHLSPYESVKRLLDTILLELDKVKIKIESEKNPSP